MKELMFEGSEKKMELLFSPTKEPLRNKPHSFWKNICDKAEARIISHFSNSFCDAYLLSESSLFVWDHRLLMLTCGRTSLVNAILSFLKSIKRSDIELLFYQRKNEFFPYSQKSSFRDDLQKIKKKIKGKAYCFGAPDDHHFYLFHSEADPHYSQKDRTIEILMYDLEDHLKELFFSKPSAKKIRSDLGLNQIFGHAQTDDYVFKPLGYSLNGLMEIDQYYTIHVTPQEPGFYVSFETNKEDESVNHIVEKVLSIFKPLSFDVITFCNKEEDSSENDFSLNNHSTFARSAYFIRNLECGYKVRFASFFTPFKKPRMAFEL